MLEIILINRVLFAAAKGQPGELAAPQVIGSL